MHVNTLIATLLLVYTTILTGQSFGEENAQILRNERSFPANERAAEQHQAVLIPNERQSMGPHLNMEPQLVWLLNLLSQIKSVPAEKREAVEGRGC